MTSKTLSHTPGPWSPNAYLDRPAFADGLTERAGFSERELAAFSLGWEKAIEACAAPDLLAALELALSHIGWCWDVIEYNTNRTRGGSAIVHDQIRAAIAKATGEQR